MLEIPEREKQNCPFVAYVLKWGGVWKLNAHNDNTSKHKVTSGSIKCYKNK